jgi:hypothetical protein
MKDANGKIRYYCKRVHSSSVLRQFMADQTIITKEPNIKVELDISIRWNSTHDMLHSALRVSRAMTNLSTHLVNEDDSIETNLVQSDWDSAKNTLMLLEPFNQGRYNNLSISDFFKLS